MHQKTINIKKLKTICQLIKDLRDVITCYDISSLEKDIFSIEKKKEKTQKFILKCVAEKHSISINDILTSNKRGIITEGRKMCFLLFYQFLEISQKEIADFFKKDTAVVNKAIKEFKNINTKIKYEKTFLNTYNELEKTIQDFIRNNQI